ADQEVIVDCLVTAAAGSNCGLMGRWADANNYYYGFLDVGLGGVYLYKVVNGTATSLGSAPRTLAINAYYKLRLLIQGTSISLFFNGESTAAVAAADSSLTTGNFGGLHAYAGGVQTVVYKDFNIIAAPASPVPISFRAASTYYSISTSTMDMTLTVPSSVQTSDVMVASIYAGDYLSSTLPVVTAPQGWTLVKQVTHGSAGLLYIYSRVAQAGEAGRTYDWQ